MIEHNNIHEAILGIMSEIGYVQKQRTAGLSYSYAGEAALIAAVRPVMLEHGVMMYVKQIKPTRSEYTNAKGTMFLVTFIEAIVSFVHVPSGTFLDVAVTGEGTDIGDKSANKALTGAYKYAIRETYMIETGDDPDKDSSDSMERKGKRTAAKEEKQPQLSELEVKVAELLSTCKAKGGEANAELIKILDAELGGHTSKNFKSIETPEKVTALLEKIKAVPDQK